MYRNQCGDLYDGEWYQDKIQGKGHYIWKNQDSYIGQWEGNRRHGYGTSKTSKETYEGYFKNDLRDGYGTCFYEEGKYEGYWSLDKRHGQGTFTWRNGDQYIG